MTDIPSTNQSNATSPDGRPVRSTAAAQQGSSESSSKDDAAIDPNAAPSAAVTAERLNTEQDFSGLRSVWAFMPYLWPKGDRDTKLRVVTALTALVIAKIFNVVTPIFFARSVDQLTGPPQMVAENPVIAIPVLLIVAYGLSRILNMVFNECRAALFARVAQRAMRRFGLQVFEHLHDLSLRFHLERRTGGLSRAIDRGTRAVQTLLDYALFSIVPILLELVLVAAILWSFFDLSFAGLTVVTVLGYIYFTVRVSEWRLQFRRQMNDSEQQANSRAIDSLINFETVKYFGNERHEIGRYDRALARYEDAAVRSQLSLSALNVGQATIIAVGLTIALYLSAKGIIAGEMSVGDFVLVHTYLLQLYQPLGFFGFVYRELRQSVIDLERMFELLHQKAEVVDKPDGASIAPGPAILRFEDVAFGYDERRPILKGISFEVPAGSKVALVGP
ncbi:MAG: ABC transporter ATP-binding protein/permease, partial [Pseudomonadota bacterium]